MSSIGRERVVDVFIRYLKAEGARVVFGIPGGLLHSFFEQIEADPEMQLVVPKHEEGAAFMADGYARSSGRLAVCAGTAGPGATNLLTGVSVAFADGVPLLVVTGQAAHMAMGKGAAQETNREDIDIVGMYRPVTKYSAMLESPKHVSHHLRRALRQALTGRQGPVHLNVPVDLWEQTLEGEDWFDPRTYRPQTSVFDRNQVARAARLILEAKRPVFLAGAGVACARAEEHVASLAELVDARVATTPRGKGAFPEDSSRSLGVLGFAGHWAARETILGDDVDVLVTLGASLNETTTFNWHPDLRPSGALIQVDVDPDRIGRNYPVEVPLVGDVQTVLVELIYHVHRAIREGRGPASQWAELPPVERRLLDAEMTISEAIPVAPQRWRQDLHEVLPPNALVFSDIGGHMLFNLHYVQIGSGQRFFLNLGFGSMGHGTVAPIGAALANPDRPVVAIVGDACFTMNGMELLTAVENDVPVVWIVENNNMHGITWHGSKMVGRQLPLETVRYRHALDVVGIARAMGLSAWTVDRPGQLQGCFLDALASGRPSLIEVRVDGNVPPPLGDRAKTIAGFSDD